MSGDLLGGFKRREQTLQVRVPARTRVGWEGERCLGTQEAPGWRGWSATNLEGSEGSEI